MSEVVIPDRKKNNTRLGTMTYNPTGGGTQHIKRGGRFSSSYFDIPLILSSSHLRFHASSVLVVVFVAMISCLCVMLVVFC